MEILVTRDHKMTSCTVGSVSIDGEKTSIVTLEDVVRDVKIPKQTAIPAGSYQVIIDYSPHFKRDLPHVLNVPGFEGVRIHPGNTAADTEGCILVGYEWKGENFIGKSKEAFEYLFTKIKEANGCTLEIR